MSGARHHPERLSLVEVSGPFLTLPVLLEAYPLGLEPHAPDYHRLLCLARDEWEAKATNTATHNTWVRFGIERPSHLAGGVPEPGLQGRHVQLPPPSGERG